MIDFRSLTAKDLVCKVVSANSKGCKISISENDKCDADILDAAVGPENWYNEFDCYQDICTCSLSVRTLCTMHNDEYPSIITKQGCSHGPRANTMDAFKQACRIWGIGRELELLPPTLWIPADRCNLVTRKRGNTTKWVCYDYFMVSRYEAGKDVDGNTVITNLEVTNTSIKSNAPVYAICRL